MSSARSNRKKINSSYVKDKSNRTSEPICEWDMNKCCDRIMKPAFLISSVLFFGFFGVKAYEMVTKMPEKVDSSKVLQKVIRYDKSGRTRR